MSQIPPIPDVWYRIQNVDYAEYLELPEAMDAGECVTRPYKENEKQYWKFVKGSGLNTYQIINAAGPSFDISYCLGVDQGTKTARSEENTPKSTTWSVSINPPTSDFCVLKDSQSNQLLQIDKGGIVNLVAQPAKTRDKQKWRIIEVTPSLPKNNYRIRHIDGARFLALHGESELRLQTEEYFGRRQGWEVIPKGNGKCEIRNLEKGLLYLAWEHGADGIIRVGISAEPRNRTWLVKTIGSDWAYSISALPDSVRNLDLALSLSENDELLLKPRKKIRNQIWFVEPTEFPPENPKPAPDVKESGEKGDGKVEDGKEKGDEKKDAEPKTPSTSGKDEVKDGKSEEGEKKEGEQKEEEKKDDKSKAGKEKEPASTGPQRFAGIPDGVYHFKNVDTNTFIKTQTNPNRPAPQSYKDSDSAMTIKYLHETSPYFTIKSTYSAPKAFCVPWDDLFVMSNDASSWYFAKTDNKDEYYIVSREKDPATASGKAPRTLSGVTKNDVNGNPVFTVVEKAEKVASQIWKVLK